MARAVAVASSLYSYLMGDLASHDILYAAVSLHPVMVKHLGIYIWATLLSADPAASQAAYLVLSQAYRVGEAVFASI